MAIEKFSAKDIDRVIHKKGYKLITFYVDGCCPCKVMEPILEDLSAAYDGEVQFYKYQLTDVVHFREDPAIKYFNAIPLPTMIYYHDQKEVYRQVGECSKAKMRRQLEDFLNNGEMA